MSANGKTISKSKVMALLLGATIGTAGASTPEVSAYLFGDSWVDCLISLKEPYDYASRAQKAAQDTHYVMRKAPYKGLPYQNIHMLKHSCPNANTGLISKISKTVRRKTTQYGLKRPSRESYAIFKSPYISWELYNTIRQAARDTARNHGLDEEKFLQTIGCESIGFNPNAKGDGGNSYGLPQIHLPSHRDPKTGKLTITREQALNWRWALGFMAKNMADEGYRRVEKGGPIIYASRAGQWWSCYREKNYLGYGYASARANPPQVVALNNN